MEADAKKFNEIWRMNEAEAKELAKKALEADRIICEQQLGLSWTPPDKLSVESLLAIAYFHNFHKNSTDSFCLPSPVFF